MIHGDIAGYDRFGRGEKLENAQRLAHGRDVWFTGADAPAIAPTGSAISTGRTSGFSGYLCPQPLPEPEVANVVRAPILSTGESRNATGTKI
jgi:hypothetical protein